MDILTLIKERDWYFDEQKVFALTIERNIVNQIYNQVADEICLHSEKFRPKSKAQVTATYLLHTLIKQFNDQWVPILKERYNTFTDHTIRSVLNRLLQFCYE